MLRNRVRNLGILGLVASSLAEPSTACATTYAFDNSVNQTNDFSITSGTSTVSFSADAPATFVVADPAGFFSFPLALGNYGSFGGDTLTITFSSPVVDRILIPFGIMDAYNTASSSLVATTNTGQTITFTPEFNELLSSNPQGTISFVPIGRISSLMLTSNFAFAIASIDVPEPTSIVILGAGVIGVAAVRRRQRA